MGFCGVCILIKQTQLAVIVQGKIAIAPFVPDFLPASQLIPPGKPVGNFVNAQEGEYDQKRRGNALQVG